MRIRWERHVRRIGEVRNAYKILVRKPEEKGPFERVVYGRIILKWSLEK
jgi:hypothetical protein